MKKRSTSRRGASDIRCLLEPLPPDGAIEESRRRPASGAHELASLLTAILGQAELARTDPSPAGRAAALIELERAADRARALCEVLQGRGAPSGRDPRSPGRPSSARTILVVDDEPAVRAAARRILEAAGHHVCEASDGDEALAIQARGDEIDLVLLDLTMPRRGGPETLAELRRIAPGLAVLVTSGYDRAEVEGLVSARDARGYLRKPFTPQSLRTAVNRALGTP